MQNNQLIQTKLNAYNIRNINNFANCFGENIKLLNFNEPKPYTKGKKQLVEI